MLPQDIQILIEPIWTAAYAEVEEGFRLNENVVLLAKGGTSDLWTIGDKYKDIVVKVYREHKNGNPVRKIMREDWTTAKLIQQVDSGMLPLLLSHSEELPAIAQNSACGCAVFAKWTGHHLSRDDIALGTDNIGRALADVVVKFEAAAKKVDNKPDFWLKNDLKSRIRRMQFEAGGQIDDLFHELKDYVVRETESGQTSPARLQHGDLHFKNLYRPDDQKPSQKAPFKLKVFDPQVSYEPPEANLRFFASEDLTLTRAFIDRYNESTGEKLNEKLIWALGALQKHGDYLRLQRMENELSLSEGFEDKKRENVERRNACIEELKKFAPTYVIQGLHEAEALPQERKPNQPVLHRNIVNRCNQG